MAIAIDSSSPAIVTASGTAQATTASFNPPARSLLVACSSWEQGVQNTAAITMSCPAGNTLTWTLRARRDGADSGAQGGTAVIYTAPNPTAQTGVTVRATSAQSADNGGLKVFVVTGADLDNAPVGATGEGSSTTDNVSPTVYTSTADNSRCIGMANDWTAAGNPTTTDTGFAYTVSSRTCGIALYKTADTATAGTSVSMNINSAGSTPQWNWVAIEVLPAPDLSFVRAVVVNQAALVRASRW